MVQLIVVGFHRSGTSLLTRILHDAGLFVGDELLGAKPSNPYGHFEDIEFLRLHRAILERHGTDWQWDASFPYFIGPDHLRTLRRLIRRRDLDHRDWGFKDPRVCLLLGTWKFLAPDAKFVIVYRDPSECVRSMESRQAADLFAGEGPVDNHLRFFREPDHGLLLWDTYNRAVVAFARHHVNDCLVVPFSDLTGGRPVVAEINARFGARLREVDTATSYDATVVGSRDAPQRVHSPQVEFRVHKTWEALEALAQRTEA